MNAYANKPMCLPLLSGGIAALLVSGIAIASLAISTQGLDGVFIRAAPPGAAAATGARATKCAECGVIESTRKIQAPGETAEVNAPGRIAAGNRGGIEEKPVGSYAITIRLQDGSTRTVNDAHPARWRLGERVTLIGAME